MPKLKLTKNELKGQSEALTRFSRYLPVLQLKKQQLQTEISKISHKIGEVSRSMAAFRTKVETWIDVFAEELKLSDWIKIGRIFLEKSNVAGIDIPIYKDIEFIEKPYDLYSTPLWVDEGIKAVKETAALKARLLVLGKQREILREELRITTQRVNLFEKVKIPEAKEAIRRIRIFLGDLFTAEVVRGKIAKAKLEKKNEVLQAAEAG